MLFAVTGSCLSDNNEKTPEIEGEGLHTGQYHIFPGEYLMLRSHIYMLVSYAFCEMIAKRLSLYMPSDIKLYMHKSIYLK